MGQHSQATLDETQQAAKNNAKTTATDSAQALPALFTPLKIGNAILSHRVVLAPLTRCRASPEGVPDVPLFTEYYGQRATKGGLLIAEATNISQQATGWFCSPGIYTEEHVTAWKPVVQAVKTKGAIFYLQLWHTGRVSHSEYQVDGKPPVGPSAIRSEGPTISPLPDGSMATGYEVPHALRAEDEIPAIVADYKRAAVNAYRAGFDGVEIHGANGYLIDQFLHEAANQRTDSYGGSIENRARFVFEVIKAVKAGWTEAAGVNSPLINNVGIRLSPYGSFNLPESNRTNPNEANQYRHVISRLNDYHLAYLHLLEPRVSGALLINTAADAEMLFSLGKLFNGPVITAGGFLADSANDTVQRALQSDPPQQVAVAFGRLFLSNPDLALRILLRAPIQKYDRTTWFTAGPVGYTDFPALSPEDIRSYTDSLSHSFQSNSKSEREFRDSVILLTQ